MKVIIRKSDDYIIGGDLPFGTPLKEDIWLAENLDPTYYDIIDIDPPVEETNLSELITTYCFKRYFYVYGEYICMYIDDSKLDAAIANYKGKLASSDYIVTKLSEAQFTHADVSQYNTSEIFADRQILRDKINELEEFKKGREYKSMYIGAENSLKFKVPLVQPQ